MQSQRTALLTLMMSTAIGALGCGVAQAQTARSAPAGSASVEEVIVTGSALPTTLDAVAVPVTTLGQEKIKESGVNTNPLEILRKVIPAFEGRGNTGANNANNTNQNTAGGSQARLRDLDTLVLINGRRVAVSAVAGIGGKVFVDVNQVAPSVIDRLEVLSDGASAIYGSDAVGGVINFILKTKFEGLEVGGRYAAAAAGYTEKSGYFTAGHSFFGDRLDLVISGQYSLTDPLYQRDRAFTNPFIVNATNVPGAVGTNLLNGNLNSPSQATPTGLAATAPNIAALVPAVYTASNAAGIGASYPLSNFQTLLLRQKIESVNGGFTALLAEDGSFTAFGDFEYSHGEGFTQFLPRVSSVTVPAGSPFNPTTGNVARVQFGEPSRPKQYYDNTDKFRATIGLRGDVKTFAREFRWEAAYTHSQDALEQQQTNLIYAPNVPLAITGGFNSAGVATPGGAFSKVYLNFDTGSALVVAPALDPFARAGRDPASLSNLFGTEHINGTSKLDTIDGKVTFDLATLPAGPIAVAIGGAWRREALSASTDPNARNTGPTAQRWLGGQFFDPFSKDRSIYAGFGEIRVPLTAEGANFPAFHAFDLIGALRYEHYSDAGDSTVPKIGFRWQPIDSQLTIRGTYSKSFTAPSLYAEYGPTDTRTAGGAIIQNSFAGQPSSPFTVEDGNNPNLQPAKATTYSIGFVAKPNFIPNLRGTLQYTSIDQRSIAGGIGFNNILVDVNNNGSKSIFFNNVAKNNFPGSAGAVGFTNPGDLLAYLQAAPGVNNLNLYAIDQFRNLGGIKLRTIDATVDYAVPTHDFGLFAFSTSLTYLISYKYQALPSQSFYEFAGFASNSPQAGGTQPKWKIYSTADWTYKGLTLTLANTYIDSVQDQGAGGFTFAASGATAIPVASYTTFDARAAYRIGGTILSLKEASVAVGVNNIGDAMPPRAANAFTDNRADVGTYSPIGRLFYAQLSARF